MRKCLGFFLVSIAFIRMDRFLVLGWLLQCAVGVLPQPPSLPAYSVTAEGTFTVSNSWRHHNRPLYGAHNSNLVLAGDRPAIHIADDSTLFGGFLVGAVIGNAEGVWAHDADNITAEYIPGSFLWTVSDSLLPGLTLFIRVLPVASGLGAVVDINVTASVAVADPITLVWAFGCGTVPASPNPLGWYFDPLVNPQNALNWTFSPTDCAGNTVTLLGNSSFGVSLGAGGATHVVVDLKTDAASTVAVGDATDWANISSLVNSTHASAASVASVGALPIPGATLWLRAASLAALPNGSPVATWQDGSGGGFDVTQARQ